MGHVLVFVIDIASIGFRFRRGLGLEFLERRSDGRLPIVPAVQPCLFIGRSGGIRRATGLSFRAGNLALGSGLIDAGRPILHHQRQFWLRSDRVIEEPRHFDLGAALLDYRFVFFLAESEREVDHLGLEAVRDETLARRSDQRDDAILFLDMLFDLGKTLNQEGLLFGFGQFESIGNRFWTCRYGC